MAVTMIALINPRLRMTSLTRVTRVALRSWGAAIVVASAALIVVACDDDGDPEDAPSPGVSIPTATPSSRATATPEPTPDAAVADRLLYEGEYEEALEVYTDVAARGERAKQDEARFAQAQLLLRAERYDEARTVLAEHLGTGGPAADASVARFMEAQALAATGDTTGALGAYERHAISGGPLAAYARAEQALSWLRRGVSMKRGRRRKLWRSRDCGRAISPASRCGLPTRFATRARRSMRWRGTGVSSTRTATSPRRSRVRARSSARTAIRRGSMTTWPSWRAIPGATAVSLIEELDAAGVPLSDYLRGVAQYRARLDDDARASFERAIAAGDRPADATYYIAAIDERAGANDEAIDGYARVPLLDPASSFADNALWWRGRLFELDGNATDASTSYGQLIDTYPASEFAADARFHRGLTLYRAREYDAASLAWAAISQDAEHGERAKMLFWRGRAQMEADDPQADATFMTLINEMPGDFYALRAEALLGRNEESEPDPELAPIETDWTAIAQYIEQQYGFDPTAVPPGPEDPRWATAAALEEAAAARRVGRGIPVDAAGRGDGHRRAVPADAAAR